MLLSTSRAEPRRREQTRHCDVNNVKGDNAVVLVQRNAFVLVRFVRCLTSFLELFVGLVFSFTVKRRLKAESRTQAGGFYSKFLR